MTVVFYISGHGFGHASRQVEVINALGAADRPPRILIRSAVNPALLARTIRGPWELRPGAVDTGVVQSSSIAHDDDRTVEEAIAFHATLDARAGAEAAALAADAVTLVVGDIPPLAFEVAARLRVPSAAIGNFTWDWIYDDYPGLAARAPGLLPRLRTAYGRATVAFELPLSGGFDVFPRVEPLPFIARRPTRDVHDTRRHFGLPADGRVALLSFGGYGLPALDAAAVDCLEAWTIVTTDRLRLPDGAPRPEGFLVVSEEAFVGTGFRYEDLVAAADAVITKPGYGIIAECVATRTAMLYTSRGRFREYDLLVAALPSLLRSRFLDPADLLAGRWHVALDALLDQPEPPDPPPVDGAEVAARRLRALAG